MALKIRNGQFVDESGNVVKPEFGNPAQVSALKDKLGDSWYKSKNFNKSSVTDEDDETYEGTMEMDVKEKTVYTFSLKFVCPKCSTKNTLECLYDFEDFMPDNDEVDSNFGGEVECRGCEQVYEYLHTNRQDYTIVSKQKEQD